MKSAGNGKNYAVSEAMIQEISNQLTENNSTYGAAETDQPCNRSDNLLRKEICGKNHDQSGPRLLPEISEAKERDGPSDGNVGNQNDEWHDSGACSERHFAGNTQRKFTPHQVTGKCSAQQTANPGGGMGHPSEHADGFNVKTAGIVEILRKPEEIEGPGRIT